MRAMRDAVDAAVGRVVLGRSISADEEGGLRIGERRGMCAMGIGARSCSMEAVSRGGSNATNGDADRACGITTNGVNEGDGVERGFVLGVDISILRLARGCFLEESRAEDVYELGGPGVEGGTDAPEEVGGGLGVVHGEGDAF